MHDFQRVDFCFFSHFLLNGKIEKTHYLITFTSRYDTEIHGVMEYPPAGKIRRKVRSALGTFYLAKSIEQIPVFALPCMTAFQAGNPSVFRAVSPVFYTMFPNPRSLGFG
ncbi:MAG: hypothetical protein ACLSFE_09925 [Christensenellales bacterium]